MFKYASLLLVLIGLFSFKKYSDVGSIPIFFRDYGVQISNIEKLGDTIYYEKSSVEKFKFVFYDSMGKCYCERFIKGKIFQKGNYENSLDTLKRYISRRFSNGRTSLITVQSFFEPLKNGIWITYKNNKAIKEKYVMGVQNNDN
jgi:hypothetical protein